MAEKPSAVSHNRYRVWHTCFYSWLARSARKGAIMKIVVCIVGLFVFLSYGLIVGVGAAFASPLQCTSEQPYPDSPFNICTGYGTACPRRICAYEPGTPGQFDINGDYTPKMG